MMNVKSNIFLWKMNLICIIKWKYIQGWIKTGQASYGNLIMRSVRIGMLFWQLWETSQLSLHTIEFLLSSSSDSLLSLTMPQVFKAQVKHTHRYPI